MRGKKTKESKGLVPVTPQRWPSQPSSLPVPQRLVKWMFKFQTIYNAQGI
jgi:hypothetical protein